MPKPTTSEDQRTRPFADFLAEHNAGRGHRLAGEQLQDVVAAVVETGKKGSITLTVSVEPMKGADETTLVTSVVVTSKVPVSPEKSAVFYADGDHNLTRKDPNQPAFEGLAEVGKPEVKDVAERPAPRAIGGGA